ncbi:hypothetical protein, partial [Actinotalea sp.]|uniref:hypothetical protein n=1 Tax=Actinotalea sp. TaxID=1872145 RepID=UPI00356AEF03
GQPGQPAPQQPWQGQPAQQQPWQGQPGQQPGQQQPWQGQPAQQQPWQGQAGQPAPQQAWQGQPGQPGQPYGYQPAGTPPSSNGKKVLIIVAIVLGVLLLLGVGAAFALRALVGGAIESYSSTASSAAETMFGSGQEYGDNAELDALWDQCEAEDWSACDELYLSSAIGSDYEAFGGSCGGRVDEAAGSCAVFNGEEPDYSFDEGVTTYGDDPELDALWDACAAGDMVACDDLYFAAPFDSEYERFGDSCGGTREEGLGEFCG